MLVDGKHNTKEYLINVLCKSNKKARFISRVNFRSKDLKHIMNQLK